LSQLRKFCRLWASGTGYVGNKTEEEGEEEEVEEEEGKKKKKITLNDTH